MIPDLEPYFSRARFPLFAHQKIGVKKLIEMSVFALFDEMGAGKTIQVIIAAQILYEMGLIDKVIVVAPASVRGVWFDPELGELKKHLFENTPNHIQQYHTVNRYWSQNIVESKPFLRWVITNYEFIRNPEWYMGLLQTVNTKTLLVLDESSSVKNHKTQQTKVCMRFRARCGRVVLLNGTPIANSPNDMYSQGHLMDGRILGCKTHLHFKSEYAIMGGFHGRAILSWRNLDKMQRLFAPYVLRRLKTDCLDLPEKLPSVAIHVPLTAITWARYKEMRDEMVTWLSHSTVSVAAQAVVKGLRLAQLTAGFIGGVQEMDPELILETTLNDVETVDDLKRIGDVAVIDYQGATNTSAVVEVGHEKLSAFIDWVKIRLEEDPNLKLLVWCRFRPELHRAYYELTEIFPHVTFGRIQGGQTRKSRADALRLLDPRTTPQGPVIVIGTTSSGSMGLNLAAAHTVIYLSNDFSLKTRLQSEDRVHRPGQVEKVSYTDIVATGPYGQKTIDHIIIKALRDKEDLATWTQSAWIQALQEE